MSTIGVLSNVYLSISTVFYTLFIDLCGYMLILQKILNFVVAQRSTSIIEIPNVHNFIVKIF